MSLNSPDHQHPFQLPTDPALVVSASPKLEAYLAALDRPVAGLGPEKLLECVISASLTAAQKEIIGNLGYLAGMSVLDSDNKKNPHDVRVECSAGENQPLVISVVSPRITREEPPRYFVRRLILVDEEHLFGNAHWRVPCEGRRHRAEGVRPLVQMDADTINLLNQRALAKKNKAGAE